MPRIVRSVTPRTVGGAELPETLSEGVTLLDLMMRRGVLKEVAERLRVPRQGGYADVDVFIFLVLLLTVVQFQSIRQFWAAVRPVQRRLAAVARRRQLPSPSSVSRYLSRAQPEHVEPFLSWLLRDSYAADAAVLRHPATMTRDTQGAAWCVFDWDATVTAVRQRGLPQGEDLPPPQRRTAALATPGYTGRKRGEVRFSRATMQHAGSGLVVHAALTATRGDTAAMLPPALAAVRTACADSDVPLDHAVVRSDGAGGCVGWITLCQQAGIAHLTRIAHYALLDDPAVRAHLNAALWEAVPDGRSGPRRCATDLGVVTLSPGKESRAADGGPLAPIQTRVVVSRFRTPEKVGAGYWLDGWQYELYATALPPAAWPAAETVACYYGRVGQENRFRQEDRELALDRLFSMQLGGQALVVGLGLYLWNLRIVLGFRHSPPPAVPVAPTPRASEPATVPPLPEVQEEGASAPEARPAAAGPHLPESPASPAAGTSPPCGCTPPAAPSLPEPSPPPVGDAPGPVATPPSAVPAAATVAPPGPAPAFVQALAQLDWTQLLASLPHDWQRAADGLGLRCPAGATLVVRAVRRVSGQQPQLRFHAHAPACRGCADRLPCGARSARFCKEVNRAIPPALADLLEQLLPQERRRRLAAPAPAAHPAAAPSPAQRPRPARTGPPVAFSHGTPPGPYAVRWPLLLVTTLRQTIQAACRLVRVRVVVRAPLGRERRHPALARDAADRQRRRQTWEQRQAYNALPQDAEVSTRFDVPRGLEWLFNEPAPASKKAA